MVVQSNFNQMDRLALLQYDSKIMIKRQFVCRKFRNIDQEFLSPRLAWIFAETWKNYFILFFVSVKWVFVGGRRSKHPPSIGKGVFFPKLL